jgi:hypothetical protein
MSLLRTRVKGWLSALRTLKVEICPSDELHQMVNNGLSVGYNFTDRKDQASPWWIPTETFLAYGSKVKKRKVDDGTFKRSLKQKVGP